MLSKLIVYPLFVFLILLAICFTLLLITKIRISFRKKALLQQNQPRKISIGFFHPIQDPSGEKERLVWSMINTLLTQNAQNFPHIEVVIYLSAYSEKATQTTIIQKVMEKYAIDIPLSLKVVKLHHGKYIEGPSRSLFKLLGHLLTTIILTTEALERHTPDYFIDTTGAYMSYGVVKALVPFCQVGTYMHNPFIKYDTLEEVAEDKTRNNHWLLQLGWPVLWLKKTYNNAVLRLPIVMGNCVDFAWANSTFTASHMRKLWPRLGGKGGAELKILFPPCGVERISHIDDSRRRNVLLSFGRFTPETGHELQLEIFQRLQLKNHKDLTFYIFGYCKNDKDKKHLQKLQRWCDKHRIKEKVAFLEEPTFGEWCEVLQEASYGIHTRKDEPFGSAIVEMMAAGLIVIADDTGGPKLDIITQKDHVPYGFRANNTKQFTEHIELCSDPKKKQFYKQVTAKAREEMQKFSETSFKEAFLKDIIEILGL